MRLSKKACPHPQSKAECEGQSLPSEGDAPEDIPVSSTPACSSPARLGTSAPPLDSESQPQRGISQDISTPLTATLPLLIWYMTMLPLVTDVADDLCLNTLFDNVTHIHGQKCPAPKPRKGKPRRASPLPSASPAESTSKTGQPWKVPSYLHPTYTH